jgi:ABC-type transport system substrate-binding protein
VGVKTKVTVMSDGALVDSLFTYKGSTFAPNFDMYIWWWTNTPDHTFAYGMYTPEEIGTFSLIPWTSPEYVAKLKQFETTLDAAQRTALGNELQQLFWQSSAAIVFFYPSTLEGYDTQDWQGYTPVGASTNGDPLYLSFNIDTYFNLQPKSADTASVVTSSSNTSTIIAIVVAVIVAVAVLVVVLLLRRRGRAIEA